MTTLAHLKALLADHEAGLELAAAAVNALPALIAVAEAARRLLAEEGYGTEGNEQWDDLRTALAAIERKEGT